MLDEPTTATNEEMRTNFIEEIINRDLATGKRQSVYTRFPPEPNGYLHIGHAKAVCVNFTTAQKYNGKCNLRFDDTNPAKESDEYVKSIQEDIAWLGFSWDKLCYASDYGETYYNVAVSLINQGKAYVCDLTPDEVKAYRGTLTTPGKNSPFRDRSIEENLTLFEGMRKGIYADGYRILRAKIDMASPNMNMRDPAIFRIVHAHHHRQGDAWCIYPMYDFAHPIEDAVEGITHSLCSLEFENHRPLYDWVLKESGMFPHPPQQIEFSRLNITRTILSKRYLRELVEAGLVSGWDDPRMPTLAGMRRRGYPPEAIRDFCSRVGVAKANSTVDVALLEHCVREQLSSTAPRVMAVLRPLKITLTNYPQGQVEILQLENHPDRPEEMREVPFSRDLYIEQDDFMIDPPGKFFRLKPGGEVRLKGAYIIKCEEVVTDIAGNVTELLCTYDPDTKSGMPGSARKVKGTLHWVEVNTAISAKVYLYEHMLKEEHDIDNNEDEGLEEETSRETAAKAQVIASFNSASLEILNNAKCEKSLANAAMGASFQFVRQGYFCVDKDSENGNMILNRIVSLKDSWSKIQQQ